uniref:CD248 molecule, endosialin a n=1 Tax=Echeneis naucrates TaxID=173247 RepID=A0A665WN56_ECHNA
TGNPQVFCFFFLFLEGISSVLGQELGERDALCNVDGCFVVYFQRRTFLDSWRACKEKGGNLATIKRQEDATNIATLFSTLDLRYSRTNIQVWIGLQRQPRQCSPILPLRGFSWTTGDQDTEYTNWQAAYTSGTCMVPRCVAMGYSTQEITNNFKWLEGACSVPVDGYLCHYAYKGMCPVLWSEGAGNALYTTPFNLLSTVLTHIPFGSVATMPCPAWTSQEQSVLCMQKEDGSVGWSRDPPLCTDSSVTHDWCDQDNGGCEHFCRATGDHFYCECVDGYELGDDGQSCELADVCDGAPCEFECLPLSDGYRCACPEGYMLAPDEHGCLDVDECLQSPCEHLCVNSLGSFQCKCREGYHLDHEERCKDIDESLTDPCEHACENTPGSHICHCHLGFSPVTEDPSRFQDIDECQIPGTCEQMCVNYEGGGFECYCKEGYELLPDHSSCRKRGEGGDRVTATPFPWGTHQPGSEWNPMEYEWSPEADWWPQLKSELELDNLPDTIYTTLPSTASFSTTSDLYKDDEETTTALPYLSTSTISEGAWNWWAGFTASSQRPGNLEDSVRGHDIVTDSSYRSEGKEEPVTLRERSEFPVEVSGEEREGYVETTLSQDPTVLTQFTPSSPLQTEHGENVDGVDPVHRDSGQKQTGTWLLVGLLVPTCILLVVLVALGIVYFTHCAVQPRNKNVSDCYHWISGAHDKQGAPNPSSGVT